MNEVIIEQIAQEQGITKKTGRNSFRAFKRGEHYPFHSAL